MLDYRCLVLGVSVLTVAACRTPGKGGAAGLDTAGLSTTVDEDGDGFPAATDCNDNDASVHPDAAELCNGIDDNCDDQVDEGVLSTYWADSDGDGFGDGGAPVQACGEPEGHVPNDTDCDDAVDTVFPGAPERCNEVDDDCNGEIDDGVETTWYADEDGDGYGDPDVSVDDCDPGDGLVADATDCDDTQPAVYPGADEVCNEQDDDCDGDVDEDVTSTFYVDVDGDGYGLFDATTEACAQPDGYAADPGDCEDGDGDIHPGAVEVCDGLDNDCDGDIDDADSSVDLSTALTVHTDADGDGYGDAGAVVLACVAPSGTVADATDCEDGNPAVHPGAAEVCNGIDDDCDAAVDDDDGSLDPSTAATWYGDGDGDGYGAGATLACVQPTGTVADGTDCDDGAAAVNPGASEVCNGIDDDCDTLVDDADSSLDTSTAGTWYSDTDGDGYGALSTGAQACSQPSGTVGDSTDCDDGAATTFPGASELCNGLDDDCDGVDDNGVVGSGAACAGLSCEDILASGASVGDGSYTVEGVSGATFDVWCDMTTDGGGWTLAGSVVNESSRHWNSYAAFTDTTTFGAATTAQTADFKSDAWYDIEGDDFMVVSADYDIAWYGVLPAEDIAGWIAGEYNSTVCSTSFLGNTPDYHSGLSTSQASAFSLTVRPLDSNCSCFPGCNESVMIGLTNADCCWVAGLGNAPNGQANWSTHDLSILQVGNITATACTAGTWPCNDDGATASSATFCYDASCKQTWAEVYVR